MADTVDVFLNIALPTELCSCRHSSVHCQFHTSKAGISLLLCIGALSISTAGCLGALQPWPRIAGEQTPLGTNLSRWRRQLVINAPPPHPLWNDGEMWSSFQRSPAGLSPRCPQQQVTRSLLHSYCFFPFPVSLQSLTYVLWDHHSNRPPNRQVQVFVSTSRFEATQTNTRGFTGKASYSDRKHKVLLWCSRLVALRHVGKAWGAGGPQK